MQRKTIFVGIDVSKETLDLVIHGSKNHLRIANNSEGFKHLLAWLKSLDVAIGECWFVFEYTGGYEYRLVQFCASRAIAFTRISGLEIKRSLGLQRGKNDKIDAGRIAQYGYEKRERLQQNKPANAVILRLRQLLTQRSAFVNQKKANEHRAKELLAMMDLNKNDSILKTYAQAVAFCEKMIAKTEAEMQTLIASDENIYKNFLLVTSVTGIGKVNGWMIIAFTENFTCFTSARKYGAYSGIVPYEHSSGKSIKGKPRVSHFANKEIKATLELAAKSSVGHDPEMKNYYERQKEKGKHHKSIMNAVKFKLVLRMFSVVNKGESYVKKPVLAA
jgi:transposase